MKHIESMNYLERLGVLLQSWVLMAVSLLAPVKMSLWLLFVLAIVDVLVGYACNHIRHGEEWKFRKAFSAIGKLCVYCFLVVIIHMAMDVFGEIALAKTLVKYLTWTIIWFYIGNILTNAKNIYYKSRGLAFLQALVTAKMAGMILTRVLLHFGIDAELPGMNKVDELDKTQE